MELSGEVSNEKCQDMLSINKKTVWSMFINVVKNHVELILTDCKLYVFYLGSMLYYQRLINICSFFMWNDM